MCATTNSKANNNKVNGGFSEKNFNKEKGELTMSTKTSSKANNAKVKGSNFNISSKDFEKAREKYIASRIDHYRDDVIDSIQSDIELIEVNGCITLDTSVKLDSCDYIYEVDIVKALNEFFKETDFFVACGTDHKIRYHFRSSL